MSHFTQGTKKTSSSGWVGFGVFAIIGGLLFCLTGIGVIIGVPAIIVGVVMIFNRHTIEGECPYCGHKLMTTPNTPGIDCQACKKRILVKGDQFHTVD